MAIVVYLVILALLILAFYAQTQGTLGNVLTELTK